MTNEEIKDYLIGKLIKRQDNKKIYLIVDISSLYLSEMLLYNFVENKPLKIKSDPYMLREIVIGTSPFYKVMNKDDKQ